MEQKHHPSWRIGEPLSGEAIGEVVQSNAPSFQVGDNVLSQFGWREHFVGAPDALKKVDATIAPLRSYLGAIGMVGLSAYVGLLKIAGLKDGETVFVSGAAGAVGNVACQIAKAKGCRVIGAAGSDEKCGWLETVAGVDKAINYRTAGDLKAAVRDAAPEGVDVFFDNVGGDHLVAAIANMKDFGRIAICGTISQYNATTKPVGPSNLNLAVPRRLRLEGFEIADHWDETPRFLADMGRWIKEGRMVCKETVVEGIENAPKALIGVFTGDNIGKMLVRLGPETHP